MTTTLAKTNATTQASAVTQTAQVISDLSSVLPEIPRKPRLYLGAEDGQPSVFYAWNSDESRRVYQQANRFTGMLTNIEVRTVSSEKYGEAHKLVTTFALEGSGQEIEIVVGTGTYCALSLVAALSGLTEAQYKGMIGISGSAGSKGVVFLNVFADGGKVVNEDATDAMKEARKAGNQHEALSQMVDAIKASIDG